MSFKGGEGKSLKGGKSAAQGGSIDMRALLAALSSSGLTLVNVSLQNAMIYSGMMDDVLIGSQQASSAIFTKVQIGYNDGTGGDFIVYGNTGDTVTYDTDGNVLTREPGDSMSWDPTAAILKILGGIQVRDPATFGNLQIDGNMLRAVNVDGNVELVPNNSNGAVLFSGNVGMNKPGSVNLGMATSFAVDSDTTSRINSRYDNYITSDRGDISLITDNRALNDIIDIRHLRTTTRTDTTTFPTPAGITTQVTELSQEIFGTTVTLNEVVTINNIETLLRKTVKEKAIVEGRPSTITTVTTTVITPATPLEEEIREVTTVTETTLDADFPNPIVELENGVTVHTAIFTTAANHGLAPEEEITISGTNSDPDFNGVVVVETVPGENKFTLTSPVPFEEGDTGRITVEKRGALNLYAGTEVSFQIDVPVFFGEKTVAERPYIEAETKDNLTLSAKYIVSKDPIVTLASNSAAFSDSGIAVEYMMNSSVKSGFFGFVDSTQNFTWIPDATITRNSDGSKNVSGEKGIMELKGVQLSQLIGDPNLTISTPQGGITFDTKDPISFDSALRIGEGVITPVGNSLQFSAPGDLALNPGGVVSITENHPLQFSPSTSITGNSGGGLSITSTLEPVHIEADITIPTGKTLFIGDDVNGEYHNAIFGDSNTITIAPAEKLVIPDDIRLQIGDTTGTGFVAHTGTLSVNSTADLGITSGGDTRIASGGGQVYIDTIQTIFPESSELLFGTGTSISTITGPNGDDNFSLVSDKPVVIGSPEINLNATTEINIPTNVHLNIGDTEGHDSHIVFDGTDNKLHIVNQNGVVVDNNLVVKGSLTVYGPTSEITSTKTTIEDPIITLGKATGAEYVKDRGVEFKYGDGKSGFMGYSQTDERFYMIKEGTNTDEVFSKDKLGDLQIDKLYANMLASTGGFLTNSISGDPYLSIDATNLNLNATTDVNIPYDIPLHFGEKNTIMGTPDALHFSSHNVKVEKGLLSINDVTLEQTDPGTLHIGNLDDLYLDSNVHIPQNIFIGEPSNVSSSIAFDPANNDLSISSAGNINLNDPVVFKDRLQIGDAEISWRDGKLVVENIHDGAPLPLSINGPITDAEWRGDIISTEFGGTGHVGTWHSRSVVYIGEDNITFEEDNANFNYNPLTHCLGLRTTIQENTLTIGSGNLEFLSVDSTILFHGASNVTGSTGTQVSYVTGKIETSFAITRPLTDVTSGAGGSTIVRPDLLVNTHGQVGITQDIAFMQTLTGAERARLYVYGDIRFNKLGSALMFSDTTYIKQLEDGTLNIFSEGALNVQSISSLTMKSDNNVEITSKDNLLIASDDQLNISSKSSLEIISLDILEVSSADSLKITSDSSLDVKSLDVLTVTSASSLSVASASSLSITSDDILSMSSLSDFNLNSALRMQINSASLLSLYSADQLLVKSAQDLIMESLARVKVTSAADLQIGSAASLSIDSGDQLNVTSLSDLSIVSQNSLTVQSTELLSITSGDILNLTSASALNITSSDSLKIKSTALLRIESTDRLQLDAAESVAITSGDRMTLNSTSLLQMSSDDRMIISCVEDLQMSSLAALSITSGDLLALNSQNRMTLDSLSSIDISSIGSLSISSDSTVSITSADILNIDSFSSLKLSSLDDLLVTSSQTLTLNSSDVLDITSSADLNVTSAQRLKLSSVSQLDISSGSALTISSIDSLDITSGRQLNVTSTENLNIASLKNLAITANESIHINSGSALEISSTDVFTISSASVLNLLSDDQLIIASDMHLDISSQDTLSIESLSALTINSGASFIASSDDILKFTSGSALTLDSADILRLHSTRLMELVSDDKLTIDAASSLELASGADVSITSVSSLVMSSQSAMAISSALSLDMSSADSLNISSQNELRMSSLSSLFVESGSLIDISSVSSLKMSSEDKVEISSASAMDISSEDLLTMSSVSTLDLSSQDQLNLFAKRDLSLHSDSTISASSSSHFSIDTGDNFSTTAQGNVLLSGNTGVAMTTGNTGNVAITAADRVTLTALSGSVDLESTSNRINMKSSTFFQKDAMFLEETTKISARLGGKLDIGSSYLTTLYSPHVLIPNRLCFRHDPVTDECQVYQQVNSNGDLEFKNSIGDILLNPLNAVKLPDVTKIEFGSAGSISSNGTNLNIKSTTGDIALQPGSEKVTLPLNTSLDFGNGTTTLKQTVEKFAVTSVTPVALNTSEVFIPDNSNLVFGDHSRRITSDGDTLFVYSKDLLSLESNNVRISGNLIVSKKSTFTIESETNFDTGIITLGGGQRENIIDLDAYIPPNETVPSTTVTLVKTGTPHNLRVGDSVFITDTIPNIDGTYVIESVPDPDTFTIPVSFPGVPPGADVQGTVRSSLTMDTGYDVGVQANWHTGATNDTSGARTAFFGFDRSTKRWTFITEATRNNNTFGGAPGDIEVGNIYADGIRATHLLSSLDTGNNLVSGSNFFVTGGSIDGTVIGNTSPAEGTFTNLHVEHGFSVGSGDVITNLNADFLDGHDSSDFVMRDGSTAMTADWFAGAYRITTGGITDTTLTENGIVLAGPNGKLMTSSQISFVDGVFSAPKIGPFQLTGDIDLNGFKITGGIFDNGQITNTTYTGGQINNTFFNNGTIAGTTSTGSTFKDGIIETSVIDRTRFTDGDITDSQIADSHFKDGTLSDSIGTNLTLNDSNFNSGHVTGSSIDTTAFTNGQIQTSTLDNNTFKNGVIQTSDIATTTFHNGTISQSNVQTSTIDASAFTNGNLTGSTFDNGNMSNSNVTTSNVSQSNVTSSVISQSTVRDTSIYTTTFDNGTIRETEVLDSNISNSNITGSTFDDGQISTTVITDTDFNDGRITNSQFSDGILRDSVVKTSTIDQSDFTNGRIALSDIATTTIHNSSLTNNEHTLSRITESKIESTELKTSTFIDGTVHTTHIDTSTIDDSTVTDSQFSNGTVDLTAITGSTFVNGQISSSTADTIAVSNGTIVTSSFANGTIRDTDIATSVFHDGEIKVTDITDSTFVSGVIDTSDIRNSTYKDGTLDNNVLTGNVYQNGQIIDSTIATTVIDNSDINNSDITTTRFIDGTIATTDISDSVFDNGKVTDTLIQSSVYEDGHINTTIFDNGSVRNSNFTTGTIDHSSFTEGTVNTSNITVPAGNTLDVTTGEVLFRDDQISGEKIKGGTADVDISGNSETVTNGLYRRDFDRDHTIMKADVAGNPHTLVVPENTLVGRLNGQLIEALSVETVQEMLDIVRRVLYVANSILKADEPGKPEALVLPNDSLLARLHEGEISAVPSREWLHTYGALLTDGHRTYPDGAKMTGNLYTSIERFSMTTGQNRALDIGVETSYISVNYSRAGGQEARCTLAPGLADGHRKVIMASRMAEKAVLIITCTFTAPGTVNPLYLLFDVAGQSATLQWDNVLQSWFIVGTGCHVITRDDTLAPNWLEIYTSNIE